MQHIQIVLAMGPLFHYLHRILGVSSIQCYVDDAAIVEQQLATAIFATEVAAADAWLVATFGPQAESQAEPPGNNQATRQTT